MCDRADGLDHRELASAKPVQPRDRVGGFAVLSGFRAFAGRYAFAGDARKSGVAHTPMSGWWPPLAEILDLPTASAANASRSCIGNTQRRIAAAVDQLVRLRKEFAFADPAMAAFQVDNRGRAFVPLA